MQRSYRQCMICPMKQVFFLNASFLNFLSMPHLLNCVLVKTQNQQKTLNFCYICSRIYICFFTITLYKQVKQKINHGHNSRYDLPTVSHYRTFGCAAATPAPIPPGGTPMIMKVSGIASLQNYVLKLITPDFLHQFQQQQYYHRDHHNHQYHQYHQCHHHHHQYRCVQHYSVIYVKKKHLYK